MSTSRALLLRIFSCLFLWMMTAGAAADSLRPVHSSPLHNHDRFQTMPREHVLNFRAYTSSFDVADDDDGDGAEDLLGVPQWVSYQLNAGAKTGNNQRPDKWIAAPGMPPGVPSPDDFSYRNSGFSRGHMCRRVHAQRLGTDANFNTFCVVNACPQRQSFNGGHWLGLEDMCSLWANKFGEIHVICGPVFDGPFSFIGDGAEVKVAIPDRFFKIVVRDNPADLNRPLVLAFMYQHSSALNDSSLAVDHSHFLVSVDSIEKATGLDFFTALSDDIEQDIEAAAASGLWSIASPSGIEMLLARRADGPMSRPLTGMSRIPRASSPLNDESGEPDARSPSYLGEVRIATWNLRWFFDEDASDDGSDIGPEFAAANAAAFSSRVVRIAEVIASFRPAILALQEVENEKVVKRLAAQLESGHAMKFKTVFVQGRDSHTGQDVAFLVRDDIAITSASRFTFTTEMRSDNQFKDLSKHCRLQCVIGGEPVEIVTAHLITNLAKRRLQAKTLRRWIQDSVATRKVVVLGDFNSRLRFAATKPGTDVGEIIGWNTESTDDDLHDTMGFLPVDRRVTHTVGAQLDRIFISQSLISGNGLSFKQVRNYRQLAGHASDHFPLVATFRSCGSPPASNLNPAAPDRNKSRAFALPPALAMSPDAAEARFSGRVAAAWDDDGRNMTLLEDFAYVDANGIKWSAPEGSVVNGASIPRPFWSLIGGPFEGKYRNASVVHDVYCVTRSCSWQDTHRMFYQACRTAGVGLVKSKTMYYAIYHFGPRWSSGFNLAARQQSLAEPDAAAIRKFITQKNPSLDEIEATSPTLLEP